MTTSAPATGSKAVGPARAAPSTTGLAAPVTSRPEPPMETTAPAPPASTTPSASAPGPTGPMSTNPSMPVVLKLKPAANTGLTNSPPGGGPPPTASGPSAASGRAETAWRSRDNIAPKVDNSPRPAQRANAAPILGPRRGYGQSDASGGGTANRRLGDGGVAVALPATKPVHPGPPGHGLAGKSGPVRRARRRRGPFLPV